MSCRAAKARQAFLCAEKTNMEEIKKFRREAVLTLREGLKWLVLGGVIGVVGGVIGALFHHEIGLASSLRLAHPWLLYTLPLIGCVIVALYQWGNMLPDRGTNRILDSVRHNEPIPKRVSALMFVCTALTQLGGGSAGREGAALQIGGSVGSFFSHRLGKKWLPERSQRMGIMCGMAAVFSGLFGTPLTAAFFVMEVTEIGALPQLAVVPCMIASFAAYYAAMLAGGSATSITMIALEPLTGVLLLKAAVLGAGCGLTALLFCKANHFSGKIYAKYIKNPYIRVITGGCLIILLTLLVGSRTYNGAGMELVTLAEQGDARWYSFLLKILFTAVTLGAGFKGGEIVPCFAVGALFGGAFAPVLGIEPALGAAVGMAAVFCGSTNCLIASLLLGLEVCSGSAYLPVFAVACAVSLFVSGPCSLYASQKRIYPRLDQPQAEAEKA